MDSRQQFEEFAKAMGWDGKLKRRGENYDDWSVNPMWLAWKASRESLGVDIRYATKKWFYESFDDELLEKMQNHGLIAQAEGFSISVMAELELEMESAMNTNGIRTK